MKKLFKNTLISIIVFYVILISFTAPFLISLIESFKPPKAERIVQKHKLKGDDPKAYGFDFENINFKSIDNKKIHGWFIKSKKPSNKCIYFVHGWKSSGVVTLEYLDIIREYGIDDHNIFIINMRNSEKAEITPTDLGYKTSKDVFAGILLLASKGIKEIKFFSISMGAMATTFALANYSNEISKTGIKISKIFLESPLSNAVKSIKAEENQITQILGELIYKPLLYFLEIRWKNQLKNLRLSKTLAKLDHSKIFITQGEKDKTTKLSSLLEEIEGLNIELKIFEQGSHAKLYRNNKEEYTKLFLNFLFLEIKSN